MPQLSGQRPVRGRIALADQAYRQSSTLDELTRINDRSAETKLPANARLPAIINAVAHGDSLSL
jgi:hypothetical protein